jgi:hypothetical protein
MDLMHDLRSGAADLLKAIGASADAALGLATEDLPKLADELLPHVASVVENLFPAPVQAIISTLAATANLTGHGNIVQTLDAGALTLIAIGRANVDAALGKLEASLTDEPPSSDVSLSSERPLTAPPSGSSQS